VKVFLSSVIGGFEDFRAAARSGAEVLRHQVIAAEDFGASSSTPQQTCLAGVREADVVVLLLGARYGAAQASGLSATHEEYREARGRKPVLAFVQRGVTAEADQASFSEEVQGWEGGGYTAFFDSPESLREEVTRALHEWELAQRAGPVDEEEVVDRARQLLPPSGGGGITGRTPLHIGVAPSPRQQALRPRELENSALHRELLQQAMFGERPVFDLEHGARDPVVRGQTLMLSQGDAEITLDEQGGLRVTQPARDRRRDPGEMPALIEETIRDRVMAAITYAGWLLDRVDPVRRLSHVAVIALLESTDFLGWRTRAEAANPRSMRMEHRQGGRADDTAVVVPRPTLLFDAANLADDITVRLRRTISG
jgi:hypothetical protein